MPSSLNSAAEKTAACLTHASSEQEQSHRQATTARKSFLCMLLATLCFLGARFSAKPVLGDGLMKTRDPTRHGGPPAEGKRCSIAAGPLRRLRRPERAKPSRRPPKAWAFSCGQLWASGGRRGSMRRGAPQEARLHL